MVVKAAPACCRRAKGEMPTFLLLLLLPLPLPLAPLAPLAPTMSSKCEEKSEARALCARVDPRGQMVSGGKALEATSAPGLVASAVASGSMVFKSEAADTKLCAPRVALEKAGKCV